MQDLETAKKRLSGESLTLCVVKDNTIVFESVLSGISGFLTAFERLGSDLKGASVADKVAGKAIALLSVHAGVRAIYAVILSKHGKAVFEEYAIHHEWNRLVESILCFDKSGTCPFEELALEISDPAKAYRKLKALCGSSP